MKKIDKNNQPLISIIMNCYNGAEYLTEAIESILSQTYENWEIIFWDNKSIDDSAKIFQSYKDSRFKYFCSPATTRLYEARNSAVTLASGEYVAFLDVDDWWEADKLEKQADVLKDENIGLVYTNFWRENEQKKTRKIIYNSNLPSGYILNDLLINYTVGILSLIIRRDILNSLDGPFDSSFHIIGDMDLVIRAAIDWQIHYIDKPLCHYRWHGKNESILNEKLKIEEFGRWVSKIEVVPVVSSLSGFKKKKELILYMSGVYEYESGNFIRSLSYLYKLPIGIMMFKLFIHYALPNYLRKKIKQ